jgi:hypothetical protein
MSGNPLEAPGVIVLENEPSDPRNKYQYKAILVRKHSDSEKSYERGFDGAWILKIVGIYDNGPDITPGQWYLDTLLGYDGYGSGKISDFIYIDAGQHWGVGNMIAVLKEAEEIAYGKMDEAFVDKYAHIPMHLRNWYQKPENQSGYEEEKKVRPPQKKKPTKKAIEKMENLEGEIADLRGYLRVLRSDNTSKNNEAEQYSSDIIETYGWSFLDMLNSGLSKEEKIKAIEEWNFSQDEKSRNIKNPEAILRDHEYYYGEESDKEEEELEKQIEEKEKELSKLAGVYESLNEGISHRMNFRRFEDEVLLPLADELGIDYKDGKVTRVQSIGKKIIERYYLLGYLTILVRDIKRIGMSGEDIEPWIVDPKKPTKGLRFGSDWGSYKEFKNKVRELIIEKEKGA